MATGTSPASLWRAPAALPQRRVLQGHDAPALCHGGPALALPARPRAPAEAGISRLVLALAVLAAPAVAQAQDIEPRAFSNAPVGVNFLI